jgi:hypothetical protein
MKRKTIMFGAVLAAFLMLMVPTMPARLLDRAKRIETIEEKTDDIVISNSGGELKWKYDYIYFFFFPVGSFLRLWLPHDKATTMISHLERGLNGEESIKNCLAKWFPDMQEQDIVWSWGFYLAYTAQFNKEQVYDIEDANGPNGVVFQCNLEYFEPGWFSFSNIRSQ